MSKQISKTINKTISVVKSQNFIIFSFLLFFLISLLIYNKFWPKHDIVYYYNLIDKQEETDIDTKISETEFASLEICRKTRQKNLPKGNTCFEDFYEKYTLQNGSKKAFQHVTMLQKKDKNFVQDCHYLAHGIGHGELQLQKNDPAKAFAMMDYATYYKNVTTCGNGYFHGIIEQFAKKTFEKEKLIKMLGNFCEEMKDRQYYVTDCFHGVGHTVFIQTNYNHKDSLDICDAITDNETYRFACHTGVFMEANQDLPTEKLTKVENGKMQFIFCDSLEEKYKPACYLENSVFFENFNKTPRDYAKNINYCKQIENKVYRMSCVRLFAARAVRISRFTDIVKMCQQNTSSRDERIVCTGVFSLRIARSIDKTRTSVGYHGAVTDICKTLPIGESSKCIDLVYNKSTLLYLINENNFNL